MNSTYESSTRKYFPPQAANQGPLGADGPLRGHLSVERNVKGTSTWDLVPSCVLAVGLSVALFLSFRRIFNTSTTN